MFGHFWTYGLQPRVPITGSGFHEKDRITKQHRQHRNHRNDANHGNPPGGHCWRNHGVVWIFMWDFWRPFLGDIALLSAENLRWENRQSPIASVQRTQSTLAGHAAVPHGTSVANKRQSRDLNCSTTNAASPRTHLFVLGDQMTANER